MNALDVAIRDKIDSIFIESYKELQAKNCTRALELANKAWTEIPDPKFDWDVTNNFTMGISETYRDCQLYKRAIKLLDDLFLAGAVESYEDGPYFLMGTIYYEMGDLDNAMKWLSQAHDISKGRCFREEDPKHLKFYLENKKGKK